MIEIFTCINFTILCVLLWKVEYSSKHRARLANILSDISNRISALAMQAEATKVIQEHNDTKAMAAKIKTGAATKTPRRGNARK